MVAVLPTAATGAAHELARHAIGSAHRHASDAGWGTNNEQIGFDFSKWLDNTRNPENAGDRWGAFNTERMGTYDDFERIAQSPKTGIDREEMLWHTGMRMNDSFRRLILERPANRQTLAEARRAIWGDKTPQWWLLNYGNQGTGAANPSAGSLSIEYGGWQASADMEDIVSRTVNAHLRKEGLLV